MKKIALLLAVLALGATVAHASSGDSAGAPCSDIIDGSYFAYHSGSAPVLDAAPQATVPSDEVTGFLLTDAPACKDVTYTLYALDDNSASVVLGHSAWTNNAQPKNADGHGQLAMAVSVAAPVPSVCVYATTTDASGAVLDRAPDHGCVSLGLDESPSYQFH